MQHQSRKRPVQKQTAFRLPIHLLERLDRFCTDRPLPTTRTAVVAAALTEFLDREEPAQRHKVSVSS